MSVVVLNKIPSPTWSWCRMNKTELVCDEQILSALENVLPDVRGEAEGLEYTENGSILWEKLPELTGGIGDDAGSLFEEAVPCGISVLAGKKIEKPVVLDYNFAQGMNVSACQVIHAQEGAEVTVVIVNSSDKDACGLEALKTEIYAEAFSKVHVIKVQLLGDDFIQIDETASYAAENASVNVTHVVLGGAKTYVGVGSSLKEYKASFRSDLAYMCKNKQELDLNYIVLQYGKKTDCKMYVNGTLRDEAKKTYRGTIDFKNGCAGSTGEEQEEVLLLSPKAVNNSIPVILCDEEDVAGEHGASIGRLSDEQLFYMESRGICQEAAENIIARAKIQRVVSLIDDEKVVEQTESFMNGLFGEE